MGDHLDRIRLPDPATRQREALRKLLSGNYMLVERRMEPCPECGVRLIPASGCRYCPSCGWGACG